MFPGGSLKILNVLKISPRLRGVPLGPRYQGISSYINLSVFSSKRNGSGCSQKVINESLPATHRSISSLRRQQKQARPTCNDNNNTNVCLRFFDGEAMEQWDNHALLTQG